ncbi:peptidase M24 [Burkholderia aenigmatica]|uniref:Peptidase M24 n=1 Tax=Burkholderia aenigmatica TaxID=2015348 RepID=A0A6P2SHB0_9BURK|nr:peptidase M24 [Burkholderia aenigmatica]
MAGDLILYLSSTIYLHDTDTVLHDIHVYRLARVQKQLLAHNIPAILLYNPVRIRYATNTSNMQV